MELGKLRGQFDLMPSRTGLPVLPPLAAVLELAALVLGIAGLDWLMPSLNLTEFQPSPYWIPILLLSLQYGTVSGLMAAGVAIAMMLLQGVAEQGVGENHFAYLLRIWAEPILWLSVAVLLGQFRMRQIERKQELIRQVQELSSQRAAIAAYAGNLRTRCAELERELVGRVEPASHRLLAALADLRSSDAAPARFGEVMVLAFGPCRAALFRIENGALRAFAATDRGDRAEIAASTALFAEIVDRGRELSVLSPADETVLAGAGLAAVPVRGADEAVTGMLLLEQAAPDMIGPETLPALRILAHHAAVMLASELQRHVPAVVARAADTTAPTLRSRFINTIRLLPSTRSKAAPQQGVENAGGADDARGHIEDTPTRVVR